MVIQSLIVSDANLLSFVWLTPDGILFSAQLELLPAPTNWSSKCETYLKSKKGNNFVHMIKVACLKFGVPEGKEPRKKIITPELF